MSSSGRRTRTRGFTRPCCKNSRRRKASRASCRRMPTSSRLPSFPTEPSFPQKPVLIIIISVLTGLVLGAFLALLCENMDVGVRSMEQVHKLLGLNPLGMVPALRASGKSRRPEREILDRPMSAYSAKRCARHRPTSCSRTSTRGRRPCSSPPRFPARGNRPSPYRSRKPWRAKVSVYYLINNIRRPTVHKMTGTPAEPGLVDWLLEKCPFGGHPYPAIRPAYHDGRPSAVGPAQSARVEPLPADAAAGLRALRRRPPQLGACPRHRRYEAARRHGR